VSRVLGKRDAILQDFADSVVTLAKVNVGASRTVKSRATGKSYRTKIDASGQLKDSIKSTLKVRAEDGRFVKGYLSFEMLEYGIYVDKGRKPGKGVSRSGQKKLAEWINKKPLQLRDKDGKYVRRTDARVKSMVYVISRNLKKYGKAPTNFFTDAYEKKEKDLFPELNEMVAQENVDYISSQLDLI
jgi:hypothetical protein